VRFKRPRRRMRRTDGNVMTAKPERVVKVSKTESTFKQILNELDRGAVAI